jgi:hypothetical protein
MYVKLTDGVATEYTLRQLRVDNPTISFPVAPSAELLAEYSIYPYTIADHPEYNTVTHSIVSGDIEQTIDGDWQKGWVLHALPEEDLAKTAREERQRLLAACDFTQLPDTARDDAEREEWAVYRQALRDITEQEGFPNTITWPVTPTRTVGE